MAEVELPEVTWHRVDLNPRTVKGGTQPEPRDSLPERMSVGEPIVLRITPALIGNDQTLASYLEQEGRDFDFLMVRLGCTFLPADGETFVSAWIRLLLERLDGGDPEPIAWSMQPDRVVDVVKQTRGIEIGPELQLEPVGLGATYSRDTEVNRKEYFIQAFNLLQPDPRWRFTPTRSTSISGSYLLTLVIRAPKDTEAEATMDLGASVRRKRLGIIPYQVAVPNSIRVFSIT
jgi:hypothetical protein